MRNGWPRFRLGALLRPINRQEDIVADRQYNILGAHWYAGGLYTKETKYGSEIAAAKVYRVEEGDFVYNRLFAWKGSFALATNENHGCYVSNEFPCFAVDRSRLDSQFLFRYFSRQSSWNESLGLSSGGTPTSRNRLKEEMLLRLEIPLPPLSEQRRIVAKIEELAAKIEEARGLRAATTRLSLALTQSVTCNVFGNSIRYVGDIASVTKLAGFEYTKYFTNAGEGDVPVVRAGNVRNSGLALENAMTIPTAISNALPRSQLHSGDVVMTFIGANIGDVTHIPASLPLIHCGPNVAKLTPSPSVDFIYLEKVLQSFGVQEQIKTIIKSTAQPCLSMKTIRLLQVPVPPLPEQRRIVAYLDEVQAKVDCVKALQAQTQAELDALLPSILDRAFKGDL